MDMNTPDPVVLAEGRHQARLEHDDTLDAAQYGYLHEQFARALKGGDLKHPLAKRQRLNEYAFEWLSEDFGGEVFDELLWIAGAAADGMDIAVIRFRSALLVEKMADRYATWEAQRL